MKSLAVMVALLWTVTGSSWANGGEHFPFHVGEKLTYQIFWGPFIAGRATLEVDGIEQVDGHDCYHLIAEAHTVGLADFLFHVESKSESWLDVVQLCTRRYRENRTEGKHFRANESEYNYDGKQLSITNFVNGKVKTAPLDGPVQDVVSSVYYVRTRPLALNMEENLLVNVSDTNYTVNVRPDLRKTMYFRPTGDVEALRIEPHPTLTIVAANKGRMWFWVSDDQRRLPLLLTSDMKIGSAKFVLFKIEPASATDTNRLRDDFATHDR
jgi:Protein of unknown function (DUF3108)